MDSEQQKQFLFQQMLRQGQNPLLHQQMMGGAQPFGGAQFFGQQAHQNQPPSGQGQHGQHTQQPSIGSGFQPAIGGQMNPLFHQNPQAQAMFAQHQALASTGSQGQPLQHSSQIGAGTHQRPQGPSSLIPGQNQQSAQHLLGQSSGGLLGQIAALGQNQPSQQQNQQSQMMLGGMFLPQIPSQQLQQQQQQQLQQPQQTHQGFQQPGGLSSLPMQQQLAPLGGQNQIAQYLKQFQDMQSQPSNNDLSQSQKTQPQSNFYGQLGSSQGQPPQSNNQLEQSNQQQQQNAQQTNQNQHSSSNIHQLNFMNQLSGQGGSSNLPSQQLNPQMQFLGQGGLPNQLSQQQQLSQMTQQSPNLQQKTPQGSIIQSQNQKQPSILGQQIGQLGGSGQQNQGLPSQLQVPSQLNQQQNASMSQIMQQNQQQQQQTNANQQTGARPTAPTSQVGTGLAGAALAAEKNLGLSGSNTVGGPSQPPGATNSNANLMNVSNLNKLAEYCATNGEYHHAIEYYLQLTNIDPDNGPAWTALGHCYLLIEDLQKSFNAYQHALYSLEDIKDPQLWYGIGILYEKFESYDHAISALIAVLKMSPNFYQKSEVLYKLGIIFAKTNQIEQAISYFQNSILTNTFTVKRKVDTLLKIGLLYEENKDYAQAQRSYEAALNHDENNYKIYQHLAWSYFLQGNINNAVEYVKKADKKNKAQADSFYILGRCFMCLENTKDALENFQQAAYKNPGEAVYWATLAIFYYNTGNYTDAFENIIKATTLNPQMSEIWYNLGVLYEKCRQPEEALIAYSKVLELDNEDADAQKRIIAIKSPFYQQEQSKNSFNLQMKYPKFTLPNSLMILRKYKKQQPGQQKSGTGQPDNFAQQLGNATQAPNTPPMNLQNNSNQLPSAQNQNSLLGQLPGLNNNQQQPSQMLQAPGMIGQRLLGQPDNNSGMQNMQQTNQQQQQQLNIPNQQQQQPSLNNQLPNPLSSGSLNQSQNQNNLQQNNSQKQLPQQQFQGQQTKTEEQSQQNQSFSAFNFNPNANIGAQKTLQGGGLGNLGSINPNPENYVNKLSEIHQILKAPHQAAGQQNSAAPSGQNPQVQLPLGGNFGQGASNESQQLQQPPNFNQQTNQGFQQFNPSSAFGATQQQPGSNPSMLFNQNQQVTQGQNMPNQGQLDINLFNPQQQQQQQQQQQPQFQQLQNQQFNQNQEAPSAQANLNLQKTNLNQILQSLPASINLQNLSREELLVLLQQQQMSQKQNEAQKPNENEETPQQQQQPQIKNNYSEEQNQEEEKQDPQQHQINQIQSTITLPDILSIQQQQQQPQMNQQDENQQQILQNMASQQQLLNQSLQQNNQGNNGNQLQMQQQPGGLQQFYGAPNMQAVNQMEHYQQQMQAMQQHEQEQSVQSKQDNNGGQEQRTYGEGQQEEVTNNVEEGERQESELSNHQLMQQQVNNQNENQVQQQQQQVDEGNQQQQQ